MKSKLLLRLYLVNAGLAVLLLVGTPIHAADDTMDQPNHPASASELPELRYLAPGKPDVIALLAPPPLPGSAEQAADLAEVIAVRRACPPEDQAAAYSEKKFSMFTFAPVIGEFLQPGKFPKTEAFVHRVQTEAETVTDNAKDFYQRPRPYRVDPSLANGKLEKSFSYPSGHSTESMTIALVLAQLFPEHRAAIIAKARSIGWHRVEIARHYPTDIYAGRVLAQAIVEEMKQSQTFQHDLAEARAELAAAPIAAKN